MLQNMRDNAQSVVAKVIVGLLVISFSLWGIHSIIGSFSSEPKVAKVNGDPITQSQFERLVELQREQMLAQMSKPDPAAIDQSKLKKTVLNGLIQQTVMYQDAHDHGLRLTDHDIDNLISSSPRYQQNGKFSEQAFEAQVRNMGLTVGEFRDLIRKEYLIRQIQAGVIASGFMSDSQVNDIMKLRFQTRSFKALNLPDSLVAKEVSVSDQEIKDYYDKHTDQFVAPESVDAAYIELSVSDLEDQVQVSDKELHNLYDQKMQAFKAHEERDAAQILIEDKGDEKAVKAKLDEIKKKIDSGADFAELARKYSDDVATAKKGGELGYATKGTYTPAFDDAVFSMKKGEVKGPVKTPFGYHFIKLLDIRSQPKPTFAQMEGKLRQELKKQEAKKLFAQKLSNLQDAVFTADSLQGPAQKFGLKVQQVNGVTRQGGPAPFDHPGLVSKLYSSDVLKDGNNSEGVHLGDDAIVFTRVVKHHPEHQETLDQVQAQVRKTLEEQKTYAKLEDEAKQLIDHLKAGSSDDSIAKDAGTSWEAHDKVGRDDQDVDGDVLTKVFGMPRPADKKPTYATVRTDKGLAILQLDAVQDPDAATLKKQFDGFQQYLARQSGANDYNDYSQQLQQQADVERY